jgi:hypothetical protein
MILSLGIGAAGVMTRRSFNLVTQKECEKIGNESQNGRRRGYAEIIIGRIFTAMRVKKVIGEGRLTEESCQNPRRDQISVKEEGNS